MIEYLKLVISPLNHSDAPVHNAPLTLYATQEQNDEGETFEVLSHEADLW
jgi:hypothetical protein